MTVTSFQWPDKLRYAPLINSLVFIFAITVLGTAVSYANAAIKTPMDEQALIYMRPRPSNGKIIVYSLFMPFFTILQSATDLLLHLYLSSPLQPIYALVVSTIYFIGWLTQWSIWMNCEVSGIGFDNAGKGGTCFQVNLNHAPNSYVPSKSSHGVVSARVGLGAVIIALYAAYGVMAALAVSRRNKGWKGT
ncbi:MAG: hypothetical protein L6R41_003652 [Letrouitia leprolyta]|nr:MAG: hypothetical protein L6R41_003652 [Letrouitia leprolyta]